MGQRSYRLGIRGIIVASLLATLVCVTGLVGVFFGQLQSIDQATISLRRQELPAVVAAANLARASEQVRVAQASLLLEIPEEEQAATRANVQTLIGRIDSGLAALEVLLPDAGGRAMFCKDRRRMAALPGDLPRVQPA